VRQVQMGVFGFFDGDEANLFPLDRADRSARLVDGFGGSEAVRERARRAFADNDLRWGVELASWLARRPDAAREDCQLLAEGLRLIAQRTSAANIRNWCLTRARELSGESENSRLYTHRFARASVLGDPVQSVYTLRVVFDPVEAEQEDLHLEWQFSDGSSAALHVRNCVACPADVGPTGAREAAAQAVIICTVAAWADLLGGKSTLAEAVRSGAIGISGDSEAALRVLHRFDVLKAKP
jgi:alkyl sulfatase BDS1-like metallo-beta-lactamase superfamily hydrolase